MKAVTAYAIILAGGEASVFERTGAWKPVPIQGESFYSLGQEPKNGFKKLVRELLDLRNTDKELSDVAVHLFFTADSDDIAAGWPAYAADYGCRDWQIVRFERWLSAARQSGDSHFGHPLRYGSWLSVPIGNTSQKEMQIDQEWLCRMMLPLVASPLANEVLKEEFERLEEVTRRQAKSLEEQNAELVERNTQLKAQLASMERLDYESLASYLPAFFRDFWNKVSPEELVQIAGGLPAPRVESPYNPLPLETVMLQKKKFLNLPTPERSRVLDLATRMRSSHNLTPHPEMRALLDNLP